MTENERIMLLEIFKDAGSLLKKVDAARKSLEEQADTAVPVQDIQEPMDLVLPPEPEFTEPEEEAIQVRIGNNKPAVSATETDRGQELKIKVKPKPKTEPEVPEDTTPAENPKAGPEPKIRDEAVPQGDEVTQESAMAETEAKADVTDTLPAAEPESVEQEKKTECKASARSENKAEKKTTDDRKAPKSAAAEETLPDKAESVNKENKKTEKGKRTEEAQVLPAKPTPVQKAKKAGTLSVLSLSAGCGGMSIGMQGGFEAIEQSIPEPLRKLCSKGSKDGWLKLPKTAFSVLAASDLNKKASVLWKKNLPDVDFTPYEEGKTDQIPDDVDVVTATLTQKEFMQKTSEGLVKGEVYENVAKAIREASPKAFLIEAVPPTVDDNDVEAELKKDFEDTQDGYLVSLMRLSSADYGVAQNRTRVILLGLKKSCLTKEAEKALSSDNIPEKYDPKPARTHTPEGNGEMLPYITAGMILNGLSEPEDSNDPSQQVYSLMKYSGPKNSGQKEIDLNSLAPVMRVEHHGNVEFRRLSKEHGGSHEDELNKGLKERRLSVRECARIQSFPDDFAIVTDTGKVVKDGISGSTGYKLVGGATPPLFAYAIARRLEEEWPLYFG